MENLFIIFAVVIGGSPFFLIVCLVIHAIIFPSYHPDPYRDDMIRNSLLTKKKE